MGAATYGLMALDFQRSTDLALEYKMAVEFRLRGLTLPASLASAEQAWTQDGNRKASPTPTSLPPAHPPATNPPSDDEGGEGDHASTAIPSISLSTQIAGHDSSDDDDRYDGSLAPVFVVPDTNAIPNSAVPSVYDPAAIAQAQKAGSDLRTIRLDNGTRLRLLTYQNATGGVLQVGRLLSDQDRMLSQYLASLLILGSAASLILALASWLLAGRSIKPAQRAWDQQQQFIANASHELRAPLTLLRANADYALRNPDVTEREKSLRDIVSEVDYMNSLVGDLLLLSRLDAQRLNLAMELIPIPGLLEETARQVEKLATQKGISVELLPAAGQVRGDTVRLRQMLLILLDNAMRFTPSGGSIRLGAMLRGKEVEILVSDTGRGIPAKDLPHMFERFYQVVNQPEEGRGNGLGLSIARSLVEAHRGHISITSQPGRGTSVQILLPVAEN